MIYYPAEDSEFLLKTILKYNSKSLLDVGTGTGYIAINYKLKHPTSRVLGSDIKLEFIEVAKQNSKKAGVEVEFIVSDLFENINEKFDIICFNAPYLPKDEHEYDVTVVDNGVVKKYMKEAPIYLNPGGKAFILVNNNTEILKSNSWKVLEKQKLFFEDLIIMVYHKYF